MLTLFVVLALTGFLAVEGDDSYDASNMAHKEMSFEWQELDSGMMTMVPLKDWMKRGLSFSVSTNNATTENARVLVFIGEEPEYEYLGYLAWGANWGMIGDADESSGTSCGLAMFQFEGNAPANMTGEWTLFVNEESGNITVWYSNGERDDDNKDMVLNERIADCAPWMWDARSLSMSQFSDGTTDHRDQYKYAQFTETSDMCMRGEFFWVDKCQKCPPGKSTVREGNNDYHDCIETRYIKCTMHHEEDGHDHDEESEDEYEMECERELCPCNHNYEECDWDGDSEEYGMCRQYMNSARGVAGATTLVAMVAAFFSL